jgi:hypothetical protein
MKKRLLFSILLIIFTLSLSAQKNRDVLYLKNGSIIYGKLLEIINGQLKLQSSDGSYFIYPMEEIDKLEKENPSFEGRKTSGLGMSTEAGVMIGSQGSEYVAPFSFNILSSYTVDTRHVLSLGSGVEFLGSPFIPIFAEYKFLLKNKRATPFFFTRVGNLFHLSDNPDLDETNQYYYKHDYRGGFSFAAGTGFEWSRDDLSTYISFAYRYARTSYYQQSYVYYDRTGYDYKYVSNYNRLEIKFGFRF